MYVTYLHYACRLLLTKYIPYLSFYSVLLVYNRIGSCGQVVEFVYKALKGKAEEAGTTQKEGATENPQAGGRSAPSLDEFENS
jgi:hypothetical protein